MSTTIKTKKQMERDLFQVQGYDSKRRKYEEKMKQLLQKTNAKDVHHRGHLQEGHGGDDDSDDDDDDDDDVSMEEEEEEEEMQVHEDQDEEMDIPMKRTNAKSSNVNKEDDLEYDIYHLMAFDKHPINKKQYNAAKQEYILNIARDNMQLLMAKIFSQKTKSTEDGLFITLPSLPTTRMPREKHIPKPKLLTKWEQFKKEKGLITRKKDKIAFDEASEEWRPTFGWNRAKSDKNEWIIPAKEGDEIGSDPFLEKKRNKKKAMELQRKNEVANKRRQENFENNIPGAIFMSNSKGIDSKNFKNRDKSKVEKTFDVASFSTASMGKFDEKLRKEPKRTELKHARKEKKSGAQFSSHEKDSQKQVLNRVLKVNAARKKQIGDKATSVYQKESEKSRRKEKKSQLTSGGKPHKMRRFTKRKK